METSTVSALDEQNISDATFRSLINQIPRPIAVFLSDGAFCFANRAALRLWGNNGPLQFIPPQIVGQTSITLPDGRVIPIETSTAVWKGQPAFIVMADAQAEERTVRKEVEARLVASQQRYHAMFNASRSIMLIIEPYSGRIEDANPAACAFYGYARAELIGMKITDINTMPPQDLLVLMSRAVDSTGGRFVFNHRLRNGEVRDVEVHSGPVEIEGRKLLYSIIHDITEQKKLEDELRQSYAIQSSILFSLSECVLIIDPHARRIVRCNEAAMTIFGFSEEELQQIEIERLHFSRQKTLKIIQDCRESFSQYHSLKIEDDLMRKNGQIFPAAIQITPIFASGGLTEYVIVVIHDASAEKKMLDELVRAQQQFKRVIAAAPIFVWAADQQGTITLAEGDLFKRWGMEPEGLVGKSITEISGVHADIKEHIERAYLGEIVEVQTRILDEWMQTSYIPIWENGETQGILGIGMAITEQVRAKNELQRRNRLLTAINVLSGTFNQPKPLETVLNTALERILNLYTLSAGWISLFPQDGSRKMTLAAAHNLPGEVLQCLRSISLPEIPEGASAIDYRLKSAVEPELKRFMPSVETIYIPIRTRDRISGVLGILRQQGEFSSEELDSLETIGRQMGAGIDNIQLARLNYEIEVFRGMDRMRAELIANVSHELRTPLGLIMLMVTTLLKQDVILDDQTRQDILRDIEEEAVRLGSIVDNLLDVSHMQRSGLHLDLQPVDVQTLIHQTVSRLAPSLTGHMVEVSTSIEDCIVDLDARRIEQVLRNLMINAAKYSPPGSPIIVSAEREDDGVVVCVRDHGIGISIQDQPRIFEQFFRVKNEFTERSPGAGLGLPICKGIVDAHNGHIWVNSDPGHGSSFYFSLPNHP